MVRSRVAAAPDTFDHFSHRGLLRPEIDPPPRPNLAGPLRMIGGELVTRDGLDLGLRVDGVPANADLGVPAVGGLDGSGIDLDPVAAIVGDDDHRPYRNASPAMAAARA